MTSPAITTVPDTPITDAARLAARHRGRRLPVVDHDGVLIGIVTRTDLLKAFLRPDEDIRQEIVREIVIRTMSLEPAALTVDVTEGVVTMTGFVEALPLITTLLEKGHGSAGRCGCPRRVDLPGPGLAREPSRSCRSALIDRPSESCMFVVGVLPSQLLAVEVFRWPVNLRSAPGQWLPDHQSLYVQSWTNVFGVAMRATFVLRARMRVGVGPERRSGVARRTTSTISSSLLCLPLQRRDLRLQLRDPLIPRRQRRRHIRRVELLRNVLRAVGVPGRDLEQDHLLGPRAIALRHQRRRQRVVVLDHPRLAPDLDPAAVGVVHHEDMGLGILREVALRDDIAGCRRSRRRRASACPAP